MFSELSGSLYTIFNLAPLLRSRPGGVPKQIIVKTTAFDNNDDSQNCKEAKLYLNFIYKNSQRLKQLNVYVSLFV